MGMTIIVASVDVQAIKGTEEYRDAYSIALGIHRKNHDHRAVDFKDCRQCKDGFGLLLTANLRGKA